MAHDIGGVSRAAPRSVPPRRATLLTPLRQHNNPPATWQWRWGGDAKLAIVAVAPLTEPRAQLFARAGTRDAAGVFYSFISHVDAHNSLL